MAKVAEIGKLRHRITIQTLVRATDGQGGFTSTWTDLATVWADIKPVSSQERLFTQKVDYQRSHKVVIRYLSDLTAGVTNTHRFIFDGRTFQIKGVRLFDEQKFYMMLDAEENQGS